MSNNNQKPFWRKILDAGVRFLLQALLNRGKQQQQQGPVVVPVSGDGRDINELLAEGEKLRDQAGLEADKRNDCFAKSQEAYQAGDGAAAKDLSNQGKEHDANMKRLNAQAAGLIFEAKQREIDPNEIDLHGLYVDEAVEFTNRRLVQDKNSGAKNLVVIYGAGTHSVGGVQKIKPAVIDLLNEQRYNYTDLEPNHGCCTVHY